MSESGGAGGAGGGLGGMARAQGCPRQMPRERIDGPDAKRVSDGVRLGWGRREVVPERVECTLVMVVHGQ